MSSSGLIYAVIVGAWAAYLVPMWLRRQDELNEARPTERFSTAIRLLSGRAGMERRYAKDLRARSTEEGSPAPNRAASPTRWTSGPSPCPRTGSTRGHNCRMERGESPQQGQQQGQQAQQPGKPAAQAKPVPQQGGAPSVKQAGAPSAKQGAPSARQSAAQVPAPARAKRPGKQTTGARRGDSAEAKARAQRLKVLARRRRTTVMLFFAFTLGAVVAAVGGLAFLWA